MCPFSSALKVRGCVGPIHHPHLCRNGGEGCNPARRPSPQAEPDDLGSCKSVRNPPARPGSRCALFCPMSSSAGARSGRSTYRKIFLKSFILFRAIYKILTITYNKKYQVKLKHNTAQSNQDILSTLVTGGWSWMVGGGGGGVRLV